MEYVDILFYSKWINNTKADNHKNELISSAFSSWLLGAGENKSWEKFVTDLGLSKVAKINKETKRAIADKAYAIADRIIGMDKR